MKLTGRVSALMETNRSRQYSGREMEEREAPASSPSRALVLLGRSWIPADSPAAAGRTFAPFLAHLIAMREQAPQLRQRRRASPVLAAARYAAVATGSRRLPLGVDRSI